MHELTITVVLEIDGDRSESSAIAADIRDAMKTAIDRHPAAAVIDSTVRLRSVMRIDML